VASRNRSTGFLLAVFLSAQVFAANSAREAAPVKGIVQHLEAPIPGALVFVYSVSDARLNRVVTRRDGSFAIDDIPAGIYDLVAYKTGFYPSLVRLWHQASPTSSTVAIDLLPAPRGGETRDVAADIWSWRDRLPADVLREITGDFPANATSGGRSSGGVLLSRAFNGEFTASNGWGGPGSSLAESDLALYGALPGSTQYALRGSYRALSGNGSEPLSNGVAREGSLTVAPSPDSAVAVTYAQRQFDSPDGSARPQMDRESVSWTSRGESGSDFEASVSRRADEGLEQASSVRPDLLPDSSQAYELRGRWSLQRDRSRYGVSVQVLQRDVRLAAGPEVRDQRISDAALSGAGERALTSWLSVGTSFVARVHSTETVMAPGATIRFQLTPQASLLVAASRRLTQSNQLASDPIRILSASAYDGAMGSEARAALSWKNDRSHASLRVEASSQSIAEPMRVYFDGDLMLDFGSVYLFDGNRLQRLSAEASARLFDLIDAAIRAEGGRIGGSVSPDASEAFDVFSASGHYYEGEASVTIRPTHTDVSCALRRIRQLLQSESGAASNFSDRVRVSVGQDLTVLGIDPFGTAWRLIVAYESDTTTVAQRDSFEDTALLKHRLMGGLSISF
jgi:hypothetical protein